METDSGSFTILQSDKSIESSPTTANGRWDHPTQSPNEGPWIKSCGVISFAPKKGPRCSRFLPSNIYLHPKKVSVNEVPKK